VRRTAAHRRGLSSHRDARALHLAAVASAVVEDRRDEDRPDVLSIGAVYGGTWSVDEFWRPAIQRVMQEVMALRRGLASPLNVNVVLHVDGELLPPVDFEGVRTGTFSQKSMHLMVQAAVPPDAVDDERAVLLGLLREAVVEAETFARQNGAAADLNEVRGIVDAMPED
jgi:hypothetical protein